MSAQTAEQLDRSITDASIAASISLLGGIIIISVIVVDEPGISSNILSCHECYGYVYNMGYI